MDTDDEGALLCHECGGWWQHLATHARLAHGVAAADYRLAHGLGVTTRLVGAGPRARMRDAFDRDRAARLERLAEHRRPHDALAASPSHRGADVWRPETRAARAAANQARGGRDLTAEESVWLESDHDLQGWADRARTLIVDGASARTVAEVSGIAVATAHQRLRRYPPRP